MIHVILSSQCEILVVALWSVVLCTCPSSISWWRYIMSTQNLPGSVVFAYRWTMSRRSCSTPTHRDNTLNFWRYCDCFRPSTSVNWRECVVVVVVAAPVVVCRLLLTLAASLACCYQWTKLYVFAWDCADMPQPWEWLKPLVRLDTGRLVG